MHTSSQRDLTTFLGRKGRGKRVFSIRRGAYMMGGNKTHRRWLTKHRTLEEKLWKIILREWNIDILFEMRGFNTGKFFLQDMKTCNIYWSKYLFPMLQVSVSFLFFLDVECLCLQISDGLWSELKGEILELAHLALLSNKWRFKFKT